MITFEAFQKLSKDEQAAMITKLQTVNVGKITAKVSEKGAMSVYGLGRFPVTLYRSQWERLFGATPELKAFMVANVDKLKEKGA